MAFARAIAVGLSQGRRPPKMGNRLGLAAGDGARVGARVGAAGALSLRWAPVEGGALCVTAHSAPPMAAVGDAVGSVDGLGRTRNPRSFTCLRAASPCVVLGTGAAVAAALAPALL